jgi:hypothetical protein
MMVMMMMLMLMMMIMMMMVKMMMIMMMMAMMLIGLPEERSPADLQGILLGQEVMAGGHQVVLELHRTLIRIPSPNLGLLPRGRTAIVADGAILDKPIRLLLGGLGHGSSSLGASQAPRHPEL